MKLTKSHQIFYSRDTFKFPNPTRISPPIFKNHSFLHHVRKLGIGNPTILSFEFQGNDYDELISQRLDLLSNECASLHSCLVHIPDAEDVEVDSKVVTVISSILALAIVFLVLGAPVWATWTIWKFYTCLSGVPLDVPEGWSIMSRGGRVGLLRVSCSG